MALFVVKAISIIIIKLVSVELLHKLTEDDQNLSNPLYRI